MERAYAEYAAHQAAELLGGKLRQVTAALRQDMESAAEALEFEKAAALRDRIRYHRRRHLLWRQLFPCLRHRPVPGQGHGRLRRQAGDR